MPKMSIIIPHKRTPLNDEALRLNINMLLSNTYNDYELIVDTESPKDPYKIWNEASVIARGDILVFTNSDVLMSKNWDIPMLKAVENNAIVVGYLIEPGNIGVAEENIQLDFGRVPSTFNRSDFESYAAMTMARLQHEGKGVKEERGWYMPCAFLKEWFNWTGGFDTTLGFPNPNDILFWNRVVEDYHTKLLRVNSFAYHFQNLSGR